MKAMHYMNNSSSIIFLAQIIATLLPLLGSSACNTHQNINAIYIRVELVTPSNFPSPLMGEGYESVSEERTYASLDEGDPSV